MAFLFLYSKTAISFLNTHFLTNVKAHICNTDSITQRFSTFFRLQAPLHNVCELSNTPFQELFYFFFFTVLNSYRTKRCGGRETAGGIAGQGQACVDFLVRRSSSRAGLSKCLPPHTPQHLSKALTAPS